MAHYSVFCVVCGLLVCLSLTPAVVCTVLMVVVCVVELVTLVRGVMIVCVWY